MTTITRKQLRSQSGIALLTTILLMLLMASMLVGFIILINSGQQVSGMNNDYSKAFYAAEAGMEQFSTPPIHRAARRSAPLLQPLPR